MEQKQFEATLKDAETQLRRVRALYDQWFAGIERMEPRVQREELQRTLARLKALPPKNTGLRFKLNQLSQQFTTYQTYWKRISRQIEEGTYKRDVLRARQLREQHASSAQPPPAAAAPSDALDIDVEIDMASVAPPPPGASDAPPGASLPPMGTLRPQSISPLAQPDATARARPRSSRPPPMSDRPRSRPTRRSSRPPAAPPAPAAGAVPEAQMRALYDRYVKARKSNAEPTDNVNYASLQKSVNKMMPKLKAKHPGKRVGFAVVVRDGKVALKPVAK